MGEGPTALSYVTHCQRTRSAIEWPYDELLKNGHELGRVNSYLEIAQTVLRKVRRPLSARGILEFAYLMNVVPTHLHGKTQHKTLQARISEDIVRNRKRSSFFRTEPGVFFLSEFLSDASLPDSFRKPITARRRIRELHGDLVLCLNRSAVKTICNHNEVMPVEPVLAALNEADSVYANPKVAPNNIVFLWSTALVRRGHLVLSYRVGRYRDDRDSFLLKRSVSFSTMVEASDNSLFGADAYGIADSAISAAKIDLDLDQMPSVTPEVTGEVEVRYFVPSFENGEVSALVGVVDFECPDWFEPTKRRLAMSDLAWLDVRQKVNDLSDFDPWSRMILEKEHQAALDDSK